MSLLQCVVLCQYGLVCSARVGVLKDAVHADSVVACSQFGQNIPVHVVRYATVQHYVMLYDVMRHDIMHCQLL